MRSPDDSGTALVEFAMTAPAFVFTVVVACQIALFMGQQFNVMQVTRETARWLAINPHTTDTDALAQARGMARPGMLPTSFTSVTTEPACASLDGSGRCATRVNAEEISVRITYDIGHVLLTSGDIVVGSMRIGLPRTLPPYTAWAPIE